MKRNIPSLSSLLAFEASARHLSFTAAGKEMHLTQTAISHQIKNLEERLETKLFVRRKNALLLTVAGQQYLESIRAAINVIHSATTRTKRDKPSEVLTLNCLPTYAIECLIPGVQEFQELNPDITLQILANQSFEQFRQRSYDIAIRYGSGNWAGFKSLLLSNEEITPVCTPELALLIDENAPHEGLAKLTQIRTYFASTYQDDWPRWLDASHLNRVDFAREIIFNLQVTALHATVNGLGVGLGRTPLIDQRIKDGSLVMPFSFRLATGSGYYLIAPEDKVELPKIKIFWQWAKKRLSQKHDRNSSS